jgi:hypothetical protein
MLAINRSANEQMTDKARCLSSGICSLGRQAGKENPVCTVLTRKSGNVSEHGRGPFSLDVRVMNFLRSTIECPVMPFMLVIPDTLEAEIK